MEEKKDEELKITDADLWALKTIELIKHENDMKTDSKYGKEDFEAIRELQKDVLKKLEEAEKEEKEGKTL